MRNARESGRGPPESRAGTYFRAWKYKRAKALPFETKPFNVPIESSVYLRVDEDVCRRDRVWREAFQTLSPGDCVFPRTWTPLLQQIGDALRGVGEPQILFLFSSSGTSTIVSRWYVVVATLATCCCLQKFQLSVAAAARLVEKAVREVYVEEHFSHSAFFRRFRGRRVVANVGEREQEVDGGGRREAGKVRVEGRLNRLPELEPVWGLEVQVTERSGEETTLDMR